MREIFALATLTTLLLQGVPAGAQSAAPVFAPTNGSEGVAIPDDYVIGPEDVLGVLFWREPDLSGDVTVRPDGKITLPLIGEIVATGLTPVALRDQLQKAGSRFLADPNVTVVVRQINSRKVFITGEVMMPGAFPLASPRNVLQLISLAG
jgi:polysaccharide export outer membrane protein